MLKKTSLIIFLILKVAGFSSSQKTEQTFSLFLTPSAEIFFEDLHLQSEQFEISEKGSLQAVGNCSFFYSNTEKDAKRTYKVTGQIISHTSKNAPKGWQIKSLFHPLSDGKVFGNASTPGNFTKIPWSDEPSMTFLTALPQERWGKGLQEVQVLIDHPKFFTSSKDFTICWTLCVE